MKKLLRIDNFLLILGILGVIGFALRFGADCYEIRIGVRAAAYGRFVLERSLDFLLPAVLCFAASVFFKKHGRTK